MNENFDPKHLWLGIPREEQPPDHYRLLGVERLELNSDVIVNAAQRQLDHLRPLSRGDDREHASSLCDEVTRARDCLLDPVSHRQYAAELQGVDARPANLAARADWRAFAEEFDQAWRAAQALQFDPQHHWLGIPLHQRPASNFRLLGLSNGESHPDVIRGAAEKQISFVRKFATGEQSEAANDLLRQLSRARAALLRTIKPREVVPTEVAVQEQNSAPTPPASVQVDKPLSGEPDLADLDASDWKVPAPMVPQPSSPVITVETQPPPKWVLALVASAVIGVTVIGSIIGVAGYISYSRRSSRQEAQMAEATNQPEAHLGEEQSSEEATAPRTASPVSADHQQVENVDLAIIDLDQLEPAEPKRERVDDSEMRRRHENPETVIENEQIVAALQQLAAFRVQLHEIQARMDQQSTTSEDHQQVLHLIEKLGRIATEFPQSRSIVDTQAEAVGASAMLMLEKMQELKRRLAATERASMDVVKPEPMDVVKPESVNRPRPNLDNEAQPSNQRPLFFTRARNWTFDQGTSFSAIVVEVNEDRVVFKSPENGREATMAIDQLTPADAGVLRLAFFGDQEEQQWEQVRTYVSRIASDPVASADPLKQSHGGSRSGPYAGLWASVCMSTGENRHQEAASLLRQVISRIERQRKVDSNRHSMTLTSALNNLAVCTIKDHQADKAAGYFVESLETMPVPSTTVLHNARQLKELSAQPGTPLSLRSSSRRNLDHALKQQPVDHESLPSGWHYNLDVDLPRYDFARETGGKRYLSEDLGAPAGPSALRVRDTWCITCKGIGSLPCKYGKCNKGTIVVQQRVQDAVNPFNGETVCGTKGFKQSCPNCSGRGSFDCPHCEGGRL